MLVLVVALSGVVVVSISAAYPGPGGKAQGVKPPAVVPEASKAQSGAASQPIIADHTTTDLSTIPEYWIEQAKANLRVSYGHTSHGSQPISGMVVLRADVSYGGLYDFNTNGAIEAGTLSLADTTPSGDLGNPDRTAWEAETRTYLNGAGSDRNVVVWSWCGQADTSVEDIELYLSLMNGLEQDFPGVTFVYMTGHLNGTGVGGNLNQRNEQIRAYCRANNKVLFDFADIESYDPDGDYFLDLGADDACTYDGGNWADEWCAANSGDKLCATCSCAHSRALNCSLKARAFWWMLARIAGWDGGAVDQGGARKRASIGGRGYGQPITYTIAVQGLTTTVQLTDEVPAGLSYLPGSLTATLGTVTDTDAPTLRWSGVLSPTPVVTVTYAVTVNTVESRRITNTATIVASGHETITSTASIVANAKILHLPLAVRKD
jgi:uncharacterized repeat protein (TIGR01451 family)